MKCFGCGAEGHLIRSCPEGAGGRRAAAAAGEGEASDQNLRRCWRVCPYRAGNLSFKKLIVKVETEANTKLEAQLTPQELYAALMSLKSGKAPGIDGLPVDFYKSFWSVLGEDLLEVFNDCLERGRLPLSCRRAVITLLPKKGDLQELKNWRPVSLLCTDYKIMSKVLASRLREVALGPSEHPVSAKGGGWTGSGPSSQQGRCLPPSVLTETPHRTCRPGLEAFILLHLAEVWWSETVGPALFLMDCRSLDTSSLPAFYRSVFSVWILLRKQRREQAGQLSVLALTGTGTVWRVSGLSQLEWTHFVQTTESCRCFHSLGQVVELAGPRLDDPCWTGCSAGIKVHSDH
ncbi:hypothetical protein L3Q82_026138, partial [Scortum barcoo]